jgi:uroporphyrinogen decarboxylase
MTSRERVIAALDHREADRVPIDLGGFQSGIHLKACQALLEYFGRKEPVRILDPIQQLAIPSEEVLRRFHADFRYVTAGAPRGFDGAIRQNRHDGRLWRDLKDEFGVAWSMPDDQRLYMDITHHPLAESDIRDLEKYPFPNGGDPTRFAGVRQRAQEIRAASDCALSSTGSTDDDPSIVGRMPSCVQAFLFRNCSDDRLGSNGRSACWIALQ